MKIGTIKEIMEGEYRVGLDESSVADLVSSGHEVYVQKGAGVNSGISDEDYLEAGARLVDTADEVWNIVELLVKVKEPLGPEYKYFRPSLTVFSFMHLSAHKDLTLELMKNKTTAIAYETIETDTKDLPCLKPMSAIAGKMAAIVGAEYLQKTKGGSGVLISGLPGVPRANAVIVGAGNVGVNALEMLVGLGANVTIIDVNLDKLAELEYVYKNKIETLYSNSKNLRKSISEADLVIGAVSLPGASTPQLIKREYYKNMKKGSVVVDVAIDQGGATEVSKPTSHQNPTYYVDGILHYCVPNIPGAVPLTATKSLNNATIKYVKMIANMGVKKAVYTNKELSRGLNILEGEIVYKAVAESLDLEYKELD
ncbi:alanine dehydrogenase [Acholeplasma equifetale]|uniref:alanine dehydrogenase n=1 Tax=Acholeplasma equifetale TaxID=264634 RepID=UPI00047DB640|nr:alanine dehydrogenase [Acholeplasma equifetale]